MKFVAVPLAAVRLGDVQAYLASLADKAAATRANATATIKSLLSFAQETGHVRFNAGKTRVVLLSARTWRELQAIRPENASPDRAVFASRRGGTALTPMQVHRIVKAAAARACLPAELSAHWLRHCHASHSLDQGAPIHLVRVLLATPQSPPLESICMPGPTTVPRDTSACDAPPPLDV